MSSGVEFEEDSFKYNRPSSAGIPSTQGFTRPQYGQPVYSNQGASGLTGFVMRLGLAKSPETAQKVLLGIMVINFIITFIVIAYFI